MKGVHCTLVLLLLDIASAPADEASPKTCFPFHERGKARDFVFTHYTPDAKTNTIVQLFCPCESGLMRLSQPMQSDRRHRQEKRKTP
jgi:hypothetical protein